MELLCCTRDDRGVIMLIGLNVMLNEVKHLRVNDDVEFIICNIGRNRAAGGRCADAVSLEESVGGCL